MGGKHHHLLQNICLVCQKQADWPAAGTGSTSPASHPDQAQELKKHTVVPDMVVGTFEDKWVGIEVFYEMDGVKPRHQGCLIQYSSLASDRNSTLPGLGYIGSYSEDREEAGLKVPNNVIRSLYLCSFSSLLFLLLPRVTWFWASPP